MFLFYFNFWHFFCCFRVCLSLFFSCSHPNHMGRMNSKSYFESNENNLCFEIDRLFWGRKSGNVLFFVFKLQIALYNFKRAVTLSMRMLWFWYSLWMFIKRDETRHFVSPINHQSHSQDITHTPSKSGSHILARYSFWSWIY